MEEKHIKPRNRQRMWKQLKTTETEQEVGVWEGRRTAGGRCWGNARGAQQPGRTQHHVSPLALSPAWGSSAKTSMVVTCGLAGSSHVFPGLDGCTFILSADICT